MSGLVKIYARPKLTNPVMLAAWPGIGSVASIVAGYLKAKMNFKRLGEIDPSYFFDAVGVLVKDNVVEAPQFPQSTFHYWKSAGGGRDIILFTGDDQPSNKGYELANCVLDVGLKYKVSRVYTFAAALTRIHHTEQPRVWGVTNRPETVGELNRHNLIRGGNLQIAGLNGLLLGVAKERGVDGICLLGEVPLYATRIQNPVAALAVVEVLLNVLGIELDVSDLAQFARETRERFKEMAAEAMGEYIDYYTEPIWERGDEEDIDEDEE